MTTLTIVTGATSSTRADVEVAFSSSARNSASRAPHGVPVSIPRSQVYFWSGLWQEREAAADRDYAEGQFRRFSNATDAIKWLLEP